VMGTTLKKGRNPQGDLRKEEKLNPKGVLCLHGGRSPGGVAGSSKGYQDVSVEEMSSVEDLRGKGLQLFIGEKATKG